MPLLGLIPSHLPLPRPLSWADAERVVVVLAGTASNPGIFRPVAHCLADNGIRVEGLSYARGGTGDLYSGIEQIRRGLTDITARAVHHDLRVDVVGHSLGGLMALRTVQFHPYLSDHLTTLVGIGACWRGVPAHPSRMVRLGKRVVGGPAFSMIERPLDHAPIPPAGLRVVSIMSPDDGVVPESSARLGEVIEVPGLSHGALARDYASIAQALDLGESGHPRISGHPDGLGKHG